MVGDLGANSAFYHKECYAHLHIIVRKELESMSIAYLSEYDIHFDRHVTRFGENL